MKKTTLVLLLLIFSLTLHAEVGIGVTAGFPDAILSFLPAFPAEAETWFGGLNIRWKQKLLFLDVSALAQVYPTFQWNDNYMFVNLGLSFDLLFLRISAGPGLIFVPLLQTEVYNDTGQWPWFFSGKLNIDAKFGAVSIGAYVNFWLYLHEELGLQSTNIAIFGVSLLYWL